MKIKREVVHILALVFLLVFSVTPGFAQTLGDARRFVAGLYAAYGKEPGPDYTAHGAGQDIYAPKLLALMRKDEAAAQGEVGAVDFDPICDCQDYSITRVTISVNRAASGKTIAQVRFKNSNAWQRVTLDLVPVGGVWKISDVHGTHVKSLLRFLENERGRVTNKGS